MQMAMEIVSHDQKCHITPLFDCLDVRNVVVPLTVLVASCDANMSANVMIWLEKSGCTSFQSSWLNKCSGTIGNAISITCCLCQYQWQYMTRKSWCTSFQALWQMEWNDATDDVISIMWHWHQHQWHTMTMLHLMSPVLT